MSLRYCQALDRPEGLFVVSACETYPGMRQASLPVVKFAREADPVALGTALLEALANPPATPSDEKALLKALGARSWKAASQQSHWVDVKQDGERLFLLPSASNQRGGSTGLAERMVECGNTPEEAGRGLLEAFARCEFRDRL